MSKRQAWGSMTERVATTRTTNPQPGETHASVAATARSAGEELPAEVKHCWVTEGDRRVPALLLTWRHDELLGWLGRVVRPVRNELGWLVAEDWLPAHQLSPTPGDPPR